LLVVPFGCAQGKPGSFFFLANSQQPMAKSQQLKTHHTFPTAFLIRQKEDKKLVTRPKNRAKKIFLIKRNEFVWL
jgi:hypothetical protein